MHVNRFNKRMVLGLLVAVLALTLPACTITQWLPSSQQEVEETPTEVFTRVVPTTAELARATVQILALTGEEPSWTTIWSGSGAIISADGLILTNAHVVDNREGEYDVLGVGVTERTDEPPRMMYLAEIAAVDYELDLAVIRITTDREGEALELSLPYVEVGDSDDVEIGDHLRIFGYPSIGGETISFTEGAVSGFSLERGVDGRAWIKTDATIAGGSSGGVGVDQDGNLVGVPTIVTSGSLEGESVDCRPLADTNQDGRIDQRDTCVPVGGFINALRPINLAAPLLAAAQTGEDYVSSAPNRTQRTGRFDTSHIRFDQLQFSTAITGAEEPEHVVDVLDTAPGDLYVFWNYEGMLDGMNWAVYWFHNQQYIAAGSLENRSWNGGAEGNWWARLSSEGELEPGLYEVVLEVEGDVWASDAIFVGGAHPHVQYKVENNSEQTICYVMLSPSLAYYWGPDELGPTEVIPPGGSRSFAVPAGEYDLRMMDCDFNQLAEVYELILDRDGGYSFEGE